MRKLWIVPVLFGLLLLGVNLLGVLQPDRPAWVNEKAAGLFVDDLKLTHEEALAAVAWLPNENETEYAVRMTQVVYDALLYPAFDHDWLYLDPTDGWFLWFIGAINPHGFNDWRVAPTVFADWRANLARGAGGCTQHAWTLVGILNDAGIEAYVKTRVNHVYATAWLGGKWWVLDPTYNVVIPHDDYTVSRDRDMVRAAYTEAAKYQQLLFDERTGVEAAVDVMTDNWSRTERPNVDNQQLMLLLGWVFPVLLIAFGIKARWG